MKEGHEPLLSKLQTGTTKHPRESKSERNTPYKDAFAFWFLPLKIGRFV